MIWDSWDCGVVHNPGNCRENSNKDMQRWGWIYVNILGRVSVTCSALPEVTTSFTIGRDTFHYFKSLQVLLRLVLNTPMDASATASLGNLCQFITTLRGKNSSCGSKTCWQHDWLHFKSCGGKGHEIILHLLSLCCKINELPGTWAAPKSDFCGEATELLFHLQGSVPQLGQEGPGSLGEMGRFWATRGAGSPETTGCHLHGEHLSWNLLPPWCRGGESGTCNTEP